MPPPVRPARSGQHGPSHISHITYHISNIMSLVTYHIMSYYLTHRKALLAFYDIDDSSAYDTISTAVRPPRSLLKM
jgi:hypothetical protein